MKYTIFLLKSKFQCQFITDIYRGVSFMYDSIHYWVSEDYPKQSKLETDITLFEEQIRLATTQVHVFNTEQELIEEQWRNHVNTIGVDPVQQYIVTKQLLLLPYLPPKIEEYYKKTFTIAERRLHSTGLIELVEHIETQKTYSNVIKYLPDGDAKDKLELILNENYNNQISQFGSMIETEIIDVHGMIAQ